MNRCVSELGDWFDTSLGQSLLADESAALDRILPHLFGYHLLQVGDIGQGRLYAASRIPHCCILGTSALAGPRCLHHLQAEPEALPFAADSLDVVLLAHVLEFAEHPHQVLREVERTLIGDGHVLILGFNPWSLWGLRRWLLTRRRTPPWSGRPIGLRRIKDWLALLDLELVHQETLAFSPPFHSARHLDIERLGRRWWPYFGGVYLLAAQKRRIPLTPIRPRWPARQPLVGAVRPTVRNPT